MIYFICKEPPDELKFPLTSINFFAKYHGKSEVDGHFGVLTRRLNEGELHYNIGNLDALVSFSNTKALEENDESGLLCVRFDPAKGLKNTKRFN